MVKVTSKLGLFHLLAYNSRKKDDCGNCLKTAKVLVNNGIDIFAEESMGRTACDLAQEYGGEELALYLKGVEKDKAAEARASLLSLSSSSLPTYEEQQAAFNRAHARDNEPKGFGYLKMAFKVIGAATLAATVFMFAKPETAKKIIGEGIVEKMLCTLNTTKEACMGFGK